MENCGIWDQSPLISELAQGRELTKQLENQLNQSCSAEFCKSLVQGIIASWEKAMSMVKPSDFHGEQHAVGPIPGTDSPRSADESPRSGTSEQAFKDQERRETFKKRKTMPKWTNQIRVCTNTGLEVPPEDGYSWRKYGQKDILGAKYPRGYYRCTHRHSKGCLATKQVQRSDENPSIFDITYRGEHTCFQKPPQNQENPHGTLDNQLLLNFKTGLRVKTENMENQDHASSSFSFPSTPVSLKYESQNHIFSSPSTLDNHFMGSSFSPFISPATSESNYFSVSPCFGGTTMNLHTSESDLTEIISAATSTTNSPMVDLDFSLDQVEFDTDFSLDASFFS